VNEPQRIVFATGNAGKVREMRAMLGSSVELVLQSDIGLEPVEETGQTFTDNALLKARHAAAASGLPALADDSGIEVDALGGAPGVHSARYAGINASDEDNLIRLLQDMQNIENRVARFQCVLVYVCSKDDPNPLIANGSWEGSIANRPSGNGGFGYDPIFIDAASGICSAEMSFDEKNAHSHRGKALSVLREMLVGVI
jgi:XTP/dITP diphosphohydrolase